MTGPRCALIEGGRLHLQHGPIDLIVGAEGPDRKKAFLNAIERFRTVLEELVEELSALRRPIGSAPPLRGPVARRMADAVAPFAPEFVTPMAAVAGAVADEILAAMLRETRLTKAYVNNGGDAAFHLAPGQTFRAAIAAPDGGFVDVHSGESVRGLATSGWQGRSFSLGIADAVTVLAANAACADAAATMIANAVDLPDHPAVQRLPARTLAPDSDLGDIPVTTGVGDLTEHEMEQALDRGERAAAGYVSRGLLVQARLVLRGRSRIVGAMATHPAEISASREKAHA